MLIYFVVLFMNDVLLWRFSKAKKEVSIKNLYLLLFIILNIIMPAVKSCGHSICLL